MLIKAIKWHGAIKRLNIGYICIFATVIPHFIEMDGTKSWMLFLQNINLGMGITIRIMRISIIL